MNPLIEMVSIPEDDLTALFSALPKYPLGGDVACGGKTTSMRAFVSPIVASLYAVSNDDSYLGCLERLKGLLGDEAVLGASAMYSMAKELLSKAQNVWESPVDMNSVLGGEWHAVWSHVLREASFYTCWGCLLEPFDVYIEFEDDAPARLEIVFRWAGPGDLPVLGIMPDVMPRAVIEMRPVDRRRAMPLRARFELPFPRTADRIIDLAVRAAKLAVRLTKISEALFR